MRPPTSLEIIKDFLEHLGTHEGLCSFPQPGQGCEIHFRLFESRRSAALDTIRHIERGLGL